MDADLWLTAQSDMDLVRVAQPQYLPWSMQQVYAQAEQGRLLELFYDQMPGGASLCAVEPWIEAIGDDETAFSISCQLRHQPAFPEIAIPSLGWTCVEDNISLTVANATELHMVMDTYMLIITDHPARLHLNRKEWSFISADGLSLGNLASGCVARAAGASTSQRIAASRNQWLRAVLVQDAARVDTLLGLLISMMADAEAKGELISTEEATQLLHRNVRAASGLGLDRLAPPDSPVPMGYAEPGHLPALSSLHTQRPLSQDSSSPFGPSSALSGAGSRHSQASCTATHYPGVLTRPTCTERDAQHSQQQKRRAVGDWITEPAHRPKGAASVQSW